MIPRGGSQQSPTLFEVERRRCRGNITRAPPQRNQTNKILGRESPTWYNVSGEYARPDHMEEETPENDRPSAQQLRREELEYRASCGTTDDLITLLNEDRSTRSLRGVTSGNTREHHSPSKGQTILGTHTDKLLHNPDKTERKLRETGSWVGQARPGRLGRVRPTRPFGGRNSREGPSTI